MCPTLILLFLYGPAFLPGPTENTKNRPQPQFDTGYNLSKFVNQAFKVVPGRKYHQEQYQTQPQTETVIL